MRRLLRLARWLWWQVGELFGLLLCLLMAALLLPLVPLLRSYESARRFYEGDEDD